MKQPVFLDDLIRKNSLQNIENDFFVTSSQMNVVNPERYPNYQIQSKTPQRVRIEDSNSTALSALKYKSIVKSPVNAQDRFQSPSKSNSRKEDEDMLSRFGLMRKTILRMSTSSQGQTDDEQFA